jgi:hypothetical protein
MVYLLQVVLLCIDFKYKFNHLKEHLLAHKYLKEDTCTFKGRSINLTHKFILHIYTHEARSCKVYFKEVGVLA